MKIAHSEVLLMAARYVLVAWPESGAVSGNDDAINGAINRLACTIRNIDADRPVAAATPAPVAPPPMTDVDRQMQLAAVEAAEAANEKAQRDAEESARKFREAEAKIQEAARALMAELSRPWLELIEDIRRMK